MNKKDTHYSKPRFLITFTIVMGILAAIRHTFSISTVAERIPQTAPSANFVDSIAPVASLDTIVPTATAYPTDSATSAETMAYMDSVAPQTPPESSQETSHHRVCGVWSYADCFPDMQDVQIEAAKKNGIPPIRNRHDAKKLVKQRRLVNICHSPYYAIDELTHSIPYLVPRAQQLLNTISVNFLDSCQAKGLPLHLPIVTSVLRTTDDVSRLQEGNQNATTNSCHCYGTTVDIAYNRFQPLTGRYQHGAPLTRWDEPLKQVLSEVLYDLRKENRCYVKYERKQGCFHLTCR